MLRGLTVATVKLAYVDRFRDPRGALRYYFRRSRSSPRIPLPGRPGDLEFMAAYQVAIAAFEPVGAVRSLAPAAGTVDALAVAYYRSPNFLGLKSNTQTTYRREIDRWREKNGAKRVVQFQRRHLLEQMAARHEASGPEAANNLLRVVRILCAFAVENDWRRDNPALGVKKFKMRGDGFVAWSEADIAKYLRHWKAGTRQRLALLLLLYTGQRRSDVIQMGRQHVSADTIRLKQSKTGAQLVIPMHPDLRGVLKRTPKDGLAVLTTQYGKPFKDGASFGNQFREWCKDAGLKERSAHGLRKSAAVRLVEAGCSSKEVAAITGHASLREIERYTKAAEQERLARQAIARLIRSGTSD
jgi:integrase